MADLSQAQYEFVLRARSIAHLLRSAELTIMNDDRSVTLRFKEAVGQHIIRAMINDFLECDADLTSAMTEGVYGDPATATLEAQPTKPLDVEVRQWALALALETYGAPFDDQTMLMRERAADLFVRYAMTGTMPSDDPKPEDPA